MQQESLSGQQVIWGQDALYEVTHYLQPKEAGRILVVKGNRSYKNIPTALDQRIHEDKHTLEVIVPPTPPQLEWLRTQYTGVSKFSPSTILAIGGGAVIDSAKMFIHFLTEGGLPPPTLLVIPTTAGSGSEATPFAVIYEGKQKLSIESPALLPEVVFIDPQVTRNLSATQRAFSGIDAWCQAVESCWSNRATPESIALATDAFKLISDTLPEAVKNTEALIPVELMLGAYTAGRAIRSTYTTGAHALSYYLTAAFDIPHGQAVAVFLPVMLRYNLQVQPSPGTVRVLDILEASNSEEGLEKMKAFIRKCQVKATLGELAVPGLDVDQLVNSINQQRFANNPRGFDCEALLENIRWSLNEDK